MKYKAIIFDFYGVVSSEVGIIWLKNKFPEEKAKAIEAKYGPPVDKEEISEDDLFKAVGELAGEDPEKIRKEWEDLAIINKEVVKLIINLKKNYKIILLSNATRLFFTKMLQENHLEKLFDDIVVSYEVKIVKPDPRIYQIALQRSGLMGAETIFIDDREVNIKGAEALGIKGILFEDVESLGIKLEQLGIK